MSDQKNIIIAITLSLCVLLGFHFFYDRPRQVEIQKTLEHQQANKDNASSQEKAKSDTISTAVVSREDAIKQSSKRIFIETGSVKGSINLESGHIDDLQLVNFKETTKPDSTNIVLLSPSNTEKAYWIDSTWRGFESLIQKNSWQFSGSDQNHTLTPNHPISIFIDLPQNLRIERTFSIDENYLITVKERFINQSSQKITTKLSTAVIRKNPTKDSEMYILHEGGVGVLEKRLKEIKYKDLEKDPPFEQRSKGGWAGFTDKYWLVAIIPNQQEATLTRFELAADNAYKCEQVSPDFTIEPGKSAEVVHSIFAGAKVLRILDGYEASHGFERFDLAVDFGWFYFITKPLFYFLEFLQKTLGSMGLAILALTVLSKVALYPFSKKSFSSMARMRELTPKIEKLKERYGNDKVKMNQELKALYQKEGANPMSGCLPQLIQAPIFFCLYKVFYVTIEVRHAPFMGWIKDLSMPDPTTVFNLFGLLPYDVPSFLQIGALPLLMGITMLIQQRMGPQPSDPAQARVMLIMPIMFTYLFAGFPAGVVLYWTFSNILTMAQQFYFNKFTSPTKVIVKKNGR